MWIFMNNEFGIVLRLVLVKETSRAPREEAVVDVDRKHEHVLTVVLIKNTLSRSRTHLALCGSS